MKSTVPCSHSGSFDRSLYRAGLIILMALSSGTVSAQEPVQSDRPEPAHWAFATIIGTGWYELEGGRSAFILTGSPQQVLRDAVIEDLGGRKIGVFIKYDAAIGFYDLNDIPGIIDSDNFSTLSFTPGIGIEIPVTPDWHFRGNAHFGWGTAIGDGTSAWIYYSGLKSRFRFGGSDKNWSLLNGLFYAGINPHGGSTQSLRGLYTGFEYSHGIHGPRAARRKYRLHWQLGYTLIEDKLRVAQEKQTYQSIGNTAELGIAISRPESPFSLWFLEFDRLGLSYSADSRGNFESLTLIFTSWFEK